MSETQDQHHGDTVIYCHNATLGRRDFYRQICLALGLAPSATAAGVFYAVSTHVETLSRERIHPVFLLEEAHLLHQDTLNHLHVLLNDEWDSRATSWRASPARLLPPTATADQPAALSPHRPRLDPRPSDLPRPQPARP